MGTEKPKTSKGTKKKDKIIKEIEVLKCTMCGEIKEEIKDFYQSKSPIFKGNKERMCICKECVVELFGNYKNRYITDTCAIYEMCRTLDVYFSKSAYEGACKQGNTNANNKNSNIASLYFQKVNSLPQYSGRTFENSDRLEEEDKMLKDEHGEAVCEFEVTNDMIIKWGHMSKEELEFLDDNYRQWITRHKCESRAEEILFEEICHMQLGIKKTRETGGDTIKRVETLQKLMLSANIRPVEQNAINSMESALMIGTIIGIIERNEPCEFFEEERKKEYKDYKGYKRYFENWALRPLKNLMTGSKDFNVVKDIESDTDESTDGEKNGDN